MSDRWVGRIGKTRLIKAGQLTFVVVVLLGLVAMGARAERLPSTVRSQGEVDGHATGDHTLALWHGGYLATVTNSIQVGATAGTRLPGELDQREADEQGQVETGNRSGSTNSRSTGRGDSDIRWWALAVVILLAAFVGVIMLDRRLNLESQKQPSDRNASPRLQREVIGTKIQPPPPTLESGDISVRVFTHAGGDHDNHDAFAVSSGHGAVAVADGATVSAFQAEWAKILTESFVIERPNISSSETRNAWWAQCLERWYAATEPRAATWRQKPEKYHSNLRLFNRRGACSTFCGLIIHPESNRSVPRFTVYVVGDTCALWFDGNEFVASQPNLSAFDTMPDLLCTRSEFPTAALQVHEGGTLPGDMVVIATDALAEYLISKEPWTESPGNPDFWSNVWDRANPDSFSEWMERLRRQDKIKADDYTMVIIRFASLSAE